MKRGLLDVLQGLGREFLGKRRLKLKSIMMFKILHDQSAPLLRNLFLKVEDCQDNYDLRNRDTDLALPKPKTDCALCSLGVTCTFIYYLLSVFCLLCMSIIVCMYVFKF